MTSVRRPADARGEAETGVTSQNRDHHRERDEIGIVSFEHDRLGRPSPRAGLLPRRLYRCGIGNDNRSKFSLAALLPQISTSPRKRREAKPATSLHNPRRDLAFQPLQAVQRVGTGFRDLDALDDEVFTEEVVMHRALVELLRR